MLSSTRKLVFSVSSSLTGIAFSAAIACGAAEPNNGGGYVFAAASSDGSADVGPGASPEESGEPDSSVGMVRLIPPPQQPEAAVTPDSSTPVPVVYLHSPDTLYRLDPSTSAIAVVGPFVGCDEVIDLALDQSSNAYVTTFSGFYTLDLATAICTLVASGNYPNSLSFVPKGTLDPNVEALVGYFGSQYVRIDPTTGALTTVGSLSGGYQSSGDIVSVIGGGAFLTVVGDNECAMSDCLLQVDPVTGDIVQNYGPLGYVSVWGLAFWGGIAYGFDDAGDVFSIDVTSGSIVTTAISVPNSLAELSFWGAGLTTAAPQVAADGGGIPIQPPPK